MRRLPLIASFVLFIALCASAAYWATQLFKPPLRPVAAPPRVAKAEVKTDAAAGLFGGRAGKAAIASNYQLRGVIFSGSAHDSVAILSADGKPAQAIRANTEVTPGVTIKEVHRDYVLLSEGGVTKRVELPESAKDLVNLATTAPMPVQNAPARPAPGTPPPPEAPRVSKSSPQPQAATPAPPAPAVAPPAVVVNPPQPATTAPVLPPTPAAGAGTAATTTTSPTTSPPAPAPAAPPAPPALGAPR
jgi:general secretion pathway protein C